MNSNKHNKQDKNKRNPKFDSSIINKMQRRKKTVISQEW